MIEFRSVRPEELPRWYAHCHSVFKLGDTEYFQRHYQADPDADPSLIFIAADGDEIVATVRVFVRRMYLLGRVVRAGGIGEVSTRPEYRRQGLAGRLLDMAIEAMARRGMEISTLFGNQRLYLEKGWRFCKSQTRLMEVAALPPLAWGLSVRPFEPEDLPVAMGLYDLYAGRLNGAVARGEDYWKRWVLPQWKAPHMLIREGRPVAYAAVQPRAEGEGTVAELCATPDAEPLLAGFLGALATEAALSRLTCMASLLPEGTPGETGVLPVDLMARVILPGPDAADSETLAKIMTEKGAGTFRADWF